MSVLPRRVGRDPLRRPVIAAIAPDDNDDVLCLAAARAAARGLPLIACAVVADEDGRAGAEVALAGRAAALLPSDAEVTIEVRVGERADELLASASAHGAALIVLGQTHAHEGILARIVSPNLPTEVLRAAACPVLLARSTSGNKLILVATDLDDPAWPTLSAAAAEAARSGGPVTVLHCLLPLTTIGTIETPGGFESATLAAAAAIGHLLEAAAQSAGLSAAVIRVEVGPAGASILELARVLAADLIIVGTHGRRAARRVLFGSTAEEVVRGATCDVLVVRVADGDPVEPPAT